MGAWASGPPTKANLRQNGPEDGTRSGNFRCPSFRTEYSIPKSLGVSYTYPASFPENFMIIQSSNRQREAGLSVKLRSSFLCHVWMLGLVISTSFPKLAGPEWRSAKLMPFHCYLTPPYNFLRATTLSSPSCRVSLAERSWIVWRRLTPPHSDRDVLLVSRSQVQKGSLLIN